MSKRMKRAVRVAVRIKDCDKVLMMKCVQAKSLAIFDEEPETYSSGLFQVSLIGAKTNFCTSK